VPQFPSMKARELRRLLGRAPLGYYEDPERKGRGSHVRLISDEHPPLLFAFHDGQSLSPGLVKKVLTKDVGLTEDQAFEHLEGKL
jgi:predicted RNA binding protein YcfA (HicA-like mRNA interferase family)